MRVVVFPKSTWRDSKLRLIIEEGSPGSRQMALDEVMLVLVSRGISEETLRLWNFSPTTLSLGRFLAVNDWVNTEKLRELKLPLIRRFTGGGPALHDERGEITWTIALRNADMMKAYGLAGKALVRAIGEFGLRGEFTPINDVVVEGKKVVGMAGAQSGNGVIVHGTFMFSTDLSLMSVIKVPKPKELARGSPTSRVSTISLILGREVTRDEVLEALLKGFSSVFSLKDGELSDLEIDLAKRFEYKYTNDKWTYVR